MLNQSLQGTEYEKEAKKVLHKLFFSPQAL